MILLSFKTSIMKPFKYLIAPLILFIVVCSLELTKKELATGDIAFYSFNASDPDGFSIITLVNIAPNSTIYFTDSEWNGNRFKKGENHMIWNSGDDVITAGTVIKFETIKTNPKVSSGKSFNTIGLNQNGDALFAYTGMIQMPEVFLAAVSNNIHEFGTLANTRLDSGSTAITYPKGTLMAKFNGVATLNKDQLIKALNHMGNYKIQKRSLTMENGLALE